MTRVSLDTSRLPQDVLSYTNKRFFDFIQTFCGTDEADLLSIQAIRSVDSFLAITDLYSIFVLDSEDVDAIQKRCGFKNRNGSCIVRPGIKSSIDYMHALLKEKQKETARMKKIQVTLNQSTALSASFSSVIPSPVNTNITSFISKKTEAEHREIINKSIDEWFIENKDELSIADIKFVCGVDYTLQFSISLDKAEIECSCGLSSTLSLSESGNFKISNYFRHLKNSCSMVQAKAVNDSNNDIGIQNNTTTQDSFASSFSQQSSTKSVRKRTRRPVAVGTAKKKIRTT